MKEFYRREAEVVARRCLSHWNRDPASPSIGSFDRVYWGWKYRDFSDATLQAAITLPMRYISEEALLPLAVPYVRFLGTIQHRNGSFDQCYPNEHTPGVVCDLLPAMCVVADFLSARDKASYSDLLGIMERAVDFTLRTDEHHGEIANHFASYSHALFRYAQFTDDSAAYSRARMYLDRTLSLFDREEGWFNEYYGPDAGYQSRCLAFLTDIAEQNSDEELWGVCAKAARFVEALMMPDGSLHPMLGVRSTALLYPSPFERLARHEVTFHPLSRKVREAWRNESVPLPSWLDFDNAIRLGEDAAQASEIAEPLDEEEVEQGSPPNIDFPRAGILVRRTARRAVYLGWRLGGTCIVYGREKDGTWRLVHEDGGYLVDGGHGKRWVSRAPDSGQYIQDDAGVTVVANFRPSLHEELTPWRLILLRLLNLTFLRSQTVGDLFRKLLVRRLISPSSGGMGRLTRSLRFTKIEVEISDSLDGLRKFSAQKRPVEIYLCRRITPAHMASSRYYQPVETQEANGGWMELITNKTSDSIRHTITLKVPA